MRRRWGVDGMRKNTMKLIAAYILVTGAILGLLFKTGVASDLAMPDSSAYLKMESGKSDPDFLNSQPRNRLPLSTA